MIWGAVHALGNFATRELERTSFYLHKVPYAVKLLIVLAFVTFAWVFFRAESIGDGVDDCRPDVHFGSGESRIVRCWPWP